MLLIQTDWFFFIFTLDRKYDPERAKASEIAAKRKRLAQIDQRVQQAEGTTVEGWRCIMKQLQERLYCT